MRTAKSQRRTLPRSSIVAVAMAVAIGLAALPSLTDRSLAMAPGMNGRLVFQRQAENHNQLFAISLDGSGLVQITNFG
jgi:hypothetical protein